MVEIFQDKKRTTKDRWSYECKSKSVDILHSFTDALMRDYGCESSFIFKNETYYTFPFDIEPSETSAPNEQVLLKELQRYARKYNRGVKK